MDVRGLCGGFAERPFARQVTGPRKRILGVVFCECAGMCGACAWDVPGMRGMCGGVVRVHGGRAGCALLKGRPWKAPERPFGRHVTGPCFSTTRKLRTGTASDLGPFSLSHS